MADSAHSVVSLLFSDIERSTQLWDAHPDLMEPALERHDRVLEAVTRRHGGTVTARAGDSYLAVFDECAAAVAAATEAQQELEAIDWDPRCVIRVRIGIHVGEAQRRDGQFLGHEVNRAARLMAAGHGGQTLLSSEAVAQLDDLDVEPLGRVVLRGLSEPMDVFQLHIVGLPDAFPPLRGLDEQLSTVPIPPTRILGREDDALVVRKLLREHRAVTVAGIGGAGKTRLAVEVANDELGSRADGVYFADLTSTISEVEVLEAVARALRLRLTGGEAVEQVIEHLAGTDVLLVLDNCEQVVEPCRDLVRRVLATRGRAAVLATSRTWLDFDGEQIHRLEPLDVDGDTPVARHLFIERATAVDSSFDPGPDDVVVIDELCRRLDGLPLAIELAAARTGVLTPVEMLAAIGDRFALLRSSRRDAGRTLDATLAWSEEMLDPHDRAFFRDLGVFVGSFDAESVAEVTGRERFDALERLEVLVSHSLVVPSAADGYTRFRLLETVRAYTTAALAATPDRFEELCEAHLQWFHRRAAIDDLFDLRVEERTLRLLRDWDNLAAAFERGASTGRWGTAVDIAVGCYGIFINHSWTAMGRTWLERCLAQRQDLTPEQFDLARNALLQVVATLDDLVAIDELSDWILKDAIDPRIRADTLVTKAIPWLQVHPPTADELHRQALAEAAAPGVPVGAASWAKTAQSWRLMFERRWDDALAVLEEAIAETLAANLTAQVPFLMDSAAACDTLRGDPDAALARLAAWEGSTSIWDTSALSRGVALAARGDLAEASDVLEEFAALAARGRLARGSNDALYGLAVLAHYEGDDERCLDLLCRNGPGRMAAMNAWRVELGHRLDAEADLEAAMLERAVSQRLLDGVEDEVRAELVRRGAATG